MTTKDYIKGRGASSNPENRFDRLHYDLDESEDRRPETTLFNDHTASIITYNNSPDVGFDASINPYRGCEHGCAYCYARPTHEYLGFSSGLDFETKILVKKNAPALLRKELASKSYKPQVLAMSGVTDPYQPVERDFEITRRCLEVLNEYNNPVAIITKNHLITRDIDILSELAAKQAVSVHVSITTLDNDLRRLLEPRTSHIEKRLEAIHQLTNAGIPSGTLIAPVIPGLTEHELPGILKAVSAAGANFAGYVLLRLPYKLKDQFTEWLEQHYPDRKEKVLNRIKAMRDGKLNNTDFGKRMRGEGIYADQIRELFRMGIEKANLSTSGPALSTDQFRRPEIDGQMRIFG